MLIFLNRNTSHWCFLPPSYLLITSCEGKIIYSALLNEFLCFFLVFLLSHLSQQLQFRIFVLFFILHFPSHLCGSLCQCTFYFLIIFILFHTILLFLGPLIWLFWFFSLSWLGLSNQVGLGVGGDSAPAPVVSWVLGRIRRPRWSPVKSYLPGLSLRVSAGCY